MRDEQHKNKSSSELTRRTFLDSSLLTIAGGAAMLMVGIKSAAAKVSQKSVNYQASPSGGKKCDTCALYQGNGKCAAVDGSVSPSGYCKLYAPK